jgi:hypothetical protein
VVAFTLPTQPARVRVTAFPRFFREIFLSLLDVAVLIDSMDGEIIKLNS